VIRFWHDFNFFVCISERNRPRNASGLRPPTSYHTALEVTLAKQVVTSTEGDEVIPGIGSAAFAMERLKEEQSRPIAPVVQSAPAPAHAPTHVLPMHPDRMMMRDQPAREPYREPAGRFERERDWDRRPDRLDPRDRPDRRFERRDDHRHH
jgi:hypothetical protein